METQNQLKFHNSDKFSYFGIELGIDQFPTILKFPTKCLVWLLPPEIREP